MKFIVVSVDYSQIMAIHTEDEVLRMCANDKRMYDDVVKAVKSRPERADNKSLWFIVEDDKVEDFKSKLADYATQKKVKIRKIKKPIIDYPNEIWKPIEGFPNYRVSNYGRVKSIKTNKLLKGQKTYNCLCVGLTNKEKHIYKLWNIGQLVLNAFKPLEQNTHKLKIQHKDGNIYNNTLTNIDWII